MHHCVFNYIGGGGWLGIMHVAPPALSSGVALAFLRLNQAYFMALFFFLAAFFSVPSLARKGAARYLGDRALRLLLPAVVYDVALAPLIYYVAGPVSTPGVPPGLAEASAAGDVYGWYWRQYKCFANNICWFLVVLFIFDCFFVASESIAACCRRRRSAARTAAAAGVAAAPSPASLSDDNNNAGLAAVVVPRGDGDVSGGAQPAAASTAQQPPYSTLFTLGALAATALGLSAAAFLVRLALPTTMFTGYALNIPVPYMVEYGVAFNLGVAARRADALPRLPSALGWASLAGAAVWSVAGWAVAVVICGGNWVPAIMGGGAGTPLGFQAYYAFYEQIFAVFWSYGLLIAFRDVVAGHAGGKAGAVIVGAAYATYILHPLFIVSYDRALLPAALPAPAAAAVLALLVVPSTWIAAALVRCVPGVKRVL